MASPVSNIRTASRAQALVWFAIVGLTSAPALCRAQVGSAARGTTRDGGSGPQPGGAMTREELVRRWDIDGNGTIDESESAIARARMRRGRMDIQRSGIDPLTGRPRNPDDDPFATGEGTESSAGQPEPDDDAPRRPRGEDGPPGTRVPALATPTAPATPAAPTTPGRRAGIRPGPQDGRTGSPQPAPRSAPTGGIGGVRAGAPAARPGYGASGSPRDLNAARTPFGLPARGATAQPGRLEEPRARWGLGAPTIPTPGSRGGPGFVPRTPLPGRVPAPAPTGPVYRPPRPTAEDFGS